MKTTGTFHVGYDEDEFPNAVRIPFKSEGFEMVFILPDPAETGSVRSMKLPTPMEQEAWEEEEIEVVLPKFKFRTKVGGLVDVAKQMGLNIFEGQSPDFSRFSSPSSQGQLYVSQLVQEAVIEVDEDGATAAAATGLDLGVRSAGSPAERLSFDRPFAFMIVDTRLKVELFRGYVENPSGVTTTPTATIEAATTATVTPAGWGCVDCGFVPGEICCQEPGKSDRCENADKCPSYIATTPTPTIKAAAVDCSSIRTEGDCKSARCSWIKPEAWKTKETKGYCMGSNLVWR